jgi:hypothetical protein
MAGRVRRHAARFLQERRLAAVEALVVAAQVGVAKGVAVDGEGAELGIVAGGVVVGAGAAGGEGETAAGVTGTVGAAGFEAIAVGELNQRGRLSVDRRRRRRIAVGATEAHEEKE